MQRVAWNDALEMVPGSTKRGSHLSLESNAFDSECEVQEFVVARDESSSLIRASGISTTSKIDGSGKGLGRVAAKAFFKNKSRGSHRHGLAKGPPIWESSEENATLPELLQAQMTAIQQVLQDSHERISHFGSEHEHKLNELRAENKLLRAYASGSGGGPKHRHRSARNSQLPSAEASNRSSVTSLHTFEVKRSPSNRFQSQEPLTTQVANGESTDKGQTGRNSGTMFTAVTPVSPLPPPSRGMNGCAKLEVEEYEEGKPESFTLALSTRTSAESTKLDSQNGGTTEVRKWEEVAEEEEEADQDDSDTGSDLSNGMFELLPIWTKETPGTLKIKKSTLNSKEKNMHHRISKLRDLTFKFTDVLAEENQKTQLCAHVERFVVHPSSVSRAIWDLMSIFLVAYDLVAIPLALFEPDETWYFTVMAWVCRLFWSIDMPLAFLTGFIKSDGSLEMRPPKIARRYLATWFALDFFLVAIDWMESSWSNGLGYARLGKSSRIFRVLRLVRLLRMLRMKEVIQVFMERMHSERLWIFSDILKIMVLVVGMAHIIACLWYGIGNTDTKEHTWVKAHLVGYHDLGSRYAMSMHWSLSQFTGGMDEMRPHTVGERVFAICIYIFTFIVAAVFVSSLTSSMTRLHFIASHQSKQFFQLRRYLYQNNISDELTLRIQRNAQHAVTESQLFMQESAVDLLDMVSEPLRIDLHFELYSPIYHLHPFFDRYSNDCPQVMRKVCHRATSMTLASCGDTMFDAGEIPAHPKMLCLLSGEMQYVSIAGTETQVKAVTWISEAVLWTPWMHLGVLTATAECRLIVLDSQKFHHIVAQYDHADMNPRKYAEQFINNLNATTEEITDLPLDNMIERHNNSRIKNRRLTIQFSKFA